MRVRILAFVVGIIVAHMLPALPAPQVLACVLLTALVLLQRRQHMLGWLLCGCVWALARAWFFFSPQLPLQLDGEIATITGVVANIPTGDRLLRRFDFDIAELQSLKRQWTGLGRARLSWYAHAPALEPGERWRLTVRLRGPSGTLNPGGTDREGQLYQYGIKTLGYVVASSRNQRLAVGAGWNVDRLRARLAAAIDDALPTARHVAVIKALALGLRADLSDEQWHVLRRTGTAHLIAISGLHISLVAAFGLMLGVRLWSLSHALTSKVPAQRAGAITGLVAALVYAAMAGFAIPTQRAAVMVSVVMIGMLSARRFAPSQLFLCALAVVLVVDPAAVLAAGFWLSFLAVAFISYSLAGRIGTLSRWQQFVYVQLAVGVGLAPVLAFAFHNNATISPLANLVAVPWVSVVVVPLVLSGVLLVGIWPAAGIVLLRGADLSLVPLWWLLAHLAELPFAIMHMAVVDLSVLLTTLIGAVIALMPRGLPGRWTSVIWLTPLLFSTIPRPAPGEFWLSVLDVGQGLAVVVQTHTHSLLYDAGPRFGKHSDAGRVMVSPFLRHARISALDQVIISHGDSDHAGGASSVLQAISYLEVRSSAPEVLLGRPGRGCASGQRWVWDGVLFAVLHPQRVSHFGRNDRSCVLKISAAGGTALLPGDIESPAEARLLDRGAGRLKADILIAPHHGSRTSSTLDFVQAVDPDFVVFPVGHRNRFGFPHPDVVERYLRVGALGFTTASSGAVMFKVRPRGVVIQEYRLENRRFWHRAAP